MAAYEIGLDAHAYAPGFDGTMFLDPASESGETADIYVRPGTPDLVHLPAGVRVDYADCTADWTPAGQPYTFGLALYTTAMAVLVDDFFTETTPGIAGGFSSLETPYVMPVEGWLGMRVANNSAVTFTQYDYTLAPTIYRLYLEYTGHRFTLGKVGFRG